MEPCLHKERRGSRRHAGTARPRRSGPCERFASSARSSAPPIGARSKRVAEQLGIGVESLRSWVKQAEIDDGVKPGLSTEDAERMKRLEQENRELKRANEILRKASAYFAQAEFDRPSK